ncbi:MAG: anhydro-N-acetylmuramic acid kinase [Calditrichaeota bacterium]|nr:MAG: anhydro-N-acetylmuramic acid kinase [Calditrichota bacterium]MBL1204896.1 anhydro-N-acetylmuramic acid kinase [Calditrichota bacterium]NOG44725.1 anhydro-N-acetylmuramic acid kinase [Calditrichota bacterium]
MSALKNLQNKKCLNILGLMSGTSCDGLDIALLEVCGSAQQTHFRLKKSCNVSYSRTRKKELLQFISKNEHTLKEISQFNFYMAEVWSEQIKQFLKNENLTEKDIDLVASHGQTIWHEPQPENFLGESISSTLQMGDPGVLAALLKIPVVGDFRVADVALGGQGAPLIPYFDWVFFSQFKKNILALNIGGISNITIIPANGDFEKVTAFDCGPGNMLIDSVCQKLLNIPFDENGKIAASGKNNPSLFEYLQELDTFAKIKPPKSTGRELYNQQYVNKLIGFAETRKISTKDFVHTLTKYTAYAIFNSSQQFINGSIEELAIAGGGAKNGFLVKLLKQFFTDVKIKPTSFYGLDEEFKEAIGFAILANETIRGKSSNVPSATGAKHAAVLGKICLV